MKNSASSYHNRNCLPIILAFLGGVLVMTLGAGRHAISQEDSASVQPQESHHRGAKPAMGVLVRYELFGDSSVFPEAERVIAETLEELENTFSDYRRESEVNRLCRNAPHLEPVAVSEHFWTLCNRAKEISERTHGAFDITVGPVSHLWRAAIKRRRLPEPEKISAALNGVGFEKLLIFPERKIQLTTAEMQLDFGGIAKGYAADVILERLREVSIRAALIDIGGDVTMFGTPKGRDNWILQIGGNTASGSSGIKLALNGGSIATSGDTEQRLLIDDVRYSHLVDPRSGLACTTSHMVTVIAEDGTTADSLASAFSILSLDEIREVASRFPRVAFRIVYREAPESTSLLTLESPEFAKFLSDE